MFFVCHFKSKGITCSQTPISYCQLQILRFWNLKGAVIANLKTNDVFSIAITKHQLLPPQSYKLVGFGRAMHLWLSNTRGRCAPPSHCSFAAPFPSYPLVIHPENKYVTTSRNRTQTHKDDSVEKRILYQIAS